MGTQKGRRCTDSGITLNKPVSVSRPRLVCIYDIDTIYSLMWLRSTVGFQLRYTEYTIWNKQQSDANKKSSRKCWETRWVFDCNALWRNHVLHLILDSKCNTLQIMKLKGSSKLRCELIDTDSVGHFRFQAFPPCSCLFSHSNFTPLMSRGQRPCRMSRFVSTVCNINLVMCTACWEIVLFCCFFLQDKVMWLTEVNVWYIHGLLILWSCHINDRMLVFQNISEMGVFQLSLEFHLFGSLSSYF